MKSFQIKFAAAIAGVLVSAGTLEAAVSLRNGNFYVGYTDLSYPGGFEPKVDRVYNSKTAFKGMFGWGWGSDYETYIRVSADGSVVVHEYGGGSRNRFTPGPVSPKELEAVVAQITAVARRKGALSTPDAISKYQQRLKSDVNYRQAEWEKWRTQEEREIPLEANRTLKRRAIQPNVLYVSNRFSHQKLKKAPTGYERLHENGKRELFNEKGQLVKVTDKNNNFIDFVYGTDGRISKITDNFNRKIFVSFNSAGLVEKVQGENGKTAEYKYSAANELIRVKDADGVVFEYRYSQDKRHNLTEILYDNKTSMQITYFGKELFENVKSVKERDGTKSEYTYWTNPKDSGHTRVGSRLLDKNGKEISKSSYEYYSRKKGDGEDWTYKIATNVDGDVTETTYNECCGLPLVIKKGGQESAFTYDKEGRVLKKITPSETTLLTYDPKIGKVNRVEKHVKSTNKKEWSEFKYDDKGNLTFAKNSDNKGVRLFYDLNGRIKTMVDQNKKQIDFTYNEHSKPIEIKDPAGGAIRVTYKNSGEVDKVDSSGGRDLANQVSTSFQGLLEIVKPAGVSLSF